MATRSAVTVLKFFAASLPIAVVDLIKLLLPSLTTAHVGHAASNNTAVLAGASLGILTFNVAGNMISTAPLNAMDTIAPQAYGAGNAIGVGLAACRAVFIAILFLLPTTPLWIFARPILVAFRQPAETAAIGAEYMRLLLPGLPPFFIFELARKFLYAQEQARLRLLPLCAAGVGLLSHLVWLRVFDGLGWRGAPLALSCSYATLAVSLLMLIRLVAPDALSKAWPNTRQRKQLFRDRVANKHFFVTSSAALLSLSEWLFWEFVCFRVGMLGTLSLAAYGIPYSLEPVVFMLPLGVGTALANTVGNALGAGQVAEAKRAAFGGLMTGAIIVGAYTVGVWLLGDSLARCFSQDSDVLAAAAELWPAFTGFLLISGPFGLSMGLLRGLGLQKYNAACVVLILWPMGVPLVAFAAQTTSMVWTMLTVAYGTLLAALLAGAGCSSWQKLSEKAIAASGGGGGGEGGGGSSSSSSSSSTDGEEGGSEMRTASSGITCMKHSAGGLAAADSYAEERRKVGEVE